MIIGIILLSITLAGINYFVGFFLAKNNVREYFKKDYQYYNTKVVTRQFDSNDKKEVKYLQGKMFDTQMKLLSLSIKPMILQFVVLIFGLQFMRSNYNEFILGVDMFGWVPGYFAVYFITYILTVKMFGIVIKKLGVVT